MQEQEQSEEEAKFTEAADGESDVSNDCPKYSMEY